MMLEERKACRVKLTFFKPSDVECKSSLASLNAHIPAGVFKDSFRARKAFVPRRLHHFYD